MGAQGMSLCEDENNQEVTRTYEPRSVHYKLRTLVRRLFVEFLFTSETQMGQESGTTTELKSVSKS